MYNVLLYTFLAIIFNHSPDSYSLDHKMAQNNNYLHVVSSTYTCTCLSTLYIYMYIVQ